MENKLDQSKQSYYKGMAKLLASYGTINAICPICNEKGQAIPPQGKYNRNYYECKNCGVFSDKKEKI